MEDMNQWWVFARTLGALALILCLIFSLSWLAKKYFHPQKWGQGSQVGIRVLQSLPLANRSKLLLVEVDGRRLLVGMTNGHITTLKDCESDSPSKNTVKFDAQLADQLEGKYVREA